MISGKYPGDSLIDLQERWSATDMLDAHDFLDLIEDMEARQAEKLRNEREANK